MKTYKHGEVPVIAFVNPASESGKTFLVWHLSQIFAKQGLQTLIVDADSKASLTKYLGFDFEASNLYPNNMVGACMQYAGTGKLDPKPHQIRQNLFAMFNDLLYMYDLEWDLAYEWFKCRDLPQPVIWSMLNCLLNEQEFDVVLIDTGSCKAVGRAVLVASDYIVTPVQYKHYKDFYNGGLYYHLSMLINEIINRAARDRKRYGFERHCYLGHVVNVDLVYKSLRSKGYVNNNDLCSEFNQELLEDEYVFDVTPKIDNPNYNQAYLGLTSFPDGLPKATVEAVTALADNILHWINLKDKGECLER